MPVRATSRFLPLLTVASLLVNGVLLAILFDGAVRPAADGERAHARLVLAAARADARGGDPRLAALLGELPAEEVAAVYEAAQARLAELVHEPERAPVPHPAATGRER